MTNMTSRYLLGPGPSPVSPRVMAAMATPTLGHLDPVFVRVLDDLRSRLERVFRVADDGFTFAVSGTGSAGLEAAVANLVEPGTRVVAVVSGYFGERLATVCERRGGVVTRVEGEWGRASDPAAVRRTVAQQGADVVAAVHAETSTGVLHPVAEIASIAREHGALTIVDAVTSLAAHPIEVGAWGIDACYSCSQKGIGAPSGMAPLTFSKTAMERRVDPRSFYLDVGLLQAYWVSRKYHHTISAPLVNALHEALKEIEDEGLEARWARHAARHRMLVAGLGAMGLTLLPPEPERLWSVNAIRVPEAIDEAQVRRHLLERYDIEIGAGLGPLAGQIWRVGFMGLGRDQSTRLAVSRRARGCPRRAGVRPDAGSRDRGRPRERSRLGHAVMRLRREPLPAACGRIRLATEAPPLIGGNPPGADQASRPVVDSEILDAHASARARSVNEALTTEGDGHVRRAACHGREEEQVARPHPTWIERNADPVLRGYLARQRDAVLAVGELDETAAVESRTVAPTELVRRAQQVERRPGNGITVDQ